MTTPTEAMDKLTLLARELGQHSSDLADVERRLEPLATRYQAFVDDFETGLWFKHVEGEKLPSAAMRLKLAHKEMEPELLGRYVALMESRKRLMKRISDLRVEVEAQRSILSALKVEMEATR